MFLDREENAMRRHAQLLAAVANGQLRRKAGGFWVEDDFTFNAWPMPRKKKPAPTFEQVKAQAAGMNKARRKRG